MKIEVSGQFNAPLHLQGKSRRYPFNGRLDVHIISGAMYSTRKRMKTKIYI
jgi:hypothetical protein